ncbi:HAD family phosphatase [Thermoanaerobacter sp. CM-CNRG TB177]|jgi:HAD superfamily hydrolase (TIGR01509 family)|uniref:HAD family hydrolase n=1 Tax=Thermoanaerobacter TaxID=1754 RepID=UPI00048C1887|nr:MULTISPECIES: HAD family phosphatase [Thermoanaerobacter]MBT1280292.1 HAD family phosphatase [Thermoanaerobacter sp. CM-CNRG TB177]
MIKAVVFDMDGVIIDSEPIHIKLENELFKSLGLEISEEEHLTFVGASSYYMWRKIKERFNLPQSVEELVEKDRKMYLDHVLRTGEIIPIEGITETVKKLFEKKYKLAVASSSPIDVIKLVVKKLAIDNCFEVLVSGDYVENSKPSPDIFLYTAAKLKVKPYECVVIEDSYNGVHGAKKAGMTVIGFKNPNSGNQDLSEADFIVDSLGEELLGIIEGLNNEKDVAEK